MSLASGTFHYAVCDTCGERVMLYDEGGYMVGESAEEVRGYVVDSGGQITADGVVTCQPCVSEPSP